MESPELRPPGRTIRERRERAGLSQDELGVLLAVHPNRVDEWEWDEAAPTPGEASRLRLVLELDRTPDGNGSGPSDAVVIHLIPAGPEPAAPAPDPRPLVIPPRPEQPPPLLAPERSLRPTPPPAAAPPLPTPARRSAPVRVTGVLGMALLISMLVAVGTLLVRQRQRTADYAARATAFESSAAVLQDERDALQVQIEVLAAEVAAEARRAEAAEETALAELTPVLEENAALQTHNQTLVEENDFLRAAVVVSAASAEVDAVALTIDDGGNAEVTGYVLDVLAGREVTATLFPTGWSLAGSPEVWARAVAEGHELGNHTFSHAGIGEMTPDEVRAEVLAWEEAVTEATGDPYQARWFRPPYGDGFADGTGTRETREALAALGYSTALWDVETYFALSSPSGPQAGGADPTAADVADHVLSTARPGSVILLHFGPLDVGALPTIIDGLRARGLEPVTMTGLIERQAAATS